MTPPSALPYCASDVPSGQSLRDVRELAVMIGGAKRTAARYELQSQAAV
jgi:hypothetical protein